MSAVHTTWAGKGSPFIAELKAKPANTRQKAERAAKPAVMVQAKPLSYTLRDGSELVITGEPWQSPRNTAGQLDGLFLELGYNQRIKLPARKVKTVAEALREWCKRHKVAACVRTKRDCGDGAGGVWMTALDGKKGGSK